MPYWEDVDGNELPSALAGWDAEATIDGAVKVEVDFLEVLRACQLPEETKLVLGLGWRSDGTSLRGHAGSIDLERGDGPREHSLDFSISGDEVSGRLFLRLTLAYLSGASAAGNLTPRLPGSVLWSTEHEIVLEGAGSRFPMEWADFSSSHGFPKGGLWLLDWDDNGLHRPLLSCLRLYLNSESGVFADAARAREPDPAQNAMLGFLRFDVGRQLVLGALAMPDLDLSEEYPEESFGQVIVRLVRGLYPDEDLDAVRLRQQAWPRSFESELQDRLRLFRDGR